MEVKETLTSLYDVYEYNDDQVIFHDILPIEDITTILAIMYGHDMNGMPIEWADYSYDFRHMNTYVYKEEMLKDGHRTELRLRVYNHFLGNRISDYF